jgi:hypothetical protein
MLDKFDDSDIVGDLTLWYPTFAVYAATAPAGHHIFHGPHIAPPADLDQVRAALRRLVDTYGERLRGEALLSVEKMRAELRERRRVLRQGRSETDDQGSPWHNFWHWANGG